MNSEREGDEEMKGREGEQGCGIVMTEGGGGRRWRGGPGAKGGERGCLQFLQEREIVEDDSAHTPQTVFIESSSNK